ncbi:MAG: YbjN domain-containing protein [Candidatus Schekmanbacteria bacterium]|nr:YbjN domain-containing protein [Candidatus Schekmanbacteria bacterium]
MLVSNSDIEIYLDESGYPFERLDDGLWRVEAPEDRVTNIILHHEEPILVMRVNLMKVPTGNPEPFFRRLLEINANEITHGAFALEEEYVIIIDTLRTENMDLNELVASLQSVAFCVRQFYKELSSFHQHSDVPAAVT